MIAVLERPRKSSVMTVIDRLLAYLDERARTQTWLASRTGIDQSSISRVLRGAQRLYFDQAIEIAKALDVSLDDLAGIPTPSNEKPPEASTIDQIVKSLGYEEALRRLVREPGPVFGPASTDRKPEEDQRRTGTR